MLYGNPSAFDSVHTLIDHRSVVNAPGIQLCMYETFERCEQVPFRTDELMFCAMVEGKKVMHHQSLQQARDFTPGQSFVIAADEQVHIDFPLATLERPTRCLTLEVDAERIANVAEQMSLSAQCSYQDQQPATLQLTHSTTTEAIYQRLAGAFTENKSDRALLIELATTELIVRLLREQDHHALLRCALHDPQATALHQVLSHIEQHIAAPLDVDTLARLACMSRSKFFSEFRRHLGMTPHAYILKRRLEHAGLMLERSKAVTETCFACGFNSISHFSRSFKQYYGQAPSAYIAQNNKSER
ncbi:AraC family transcriptional regulator [Pseudoalteromonas ruthenica]|uniref:AraC family transcriptional regulator n=1 Tax=Pseudoalteromonas ruthenica TaxID=151081 RepID=UPI001246F00D|nr:AraC family transcriptional regulator [Pseudoalteromonas ruthenica]